MQDIGRRQDELQRGAPLERGQVARSEELFCYNLLEGLACSWPGGTSSLQIRQINI